MNHAARDLVLLVPDQNTKSSLDALLRRTRELGIRPVSFDVFKHPQHDPGCFHTSHDFLRAQSRRYRHALVLFDREGSGQELHREEIGRQVTARLAANGWDDRARAIVIDPELEIWVWTASPHVSHCLGWANRQPGLRDWLAGKGLWAQEAGKPNNPKAAVESALREVRKVRSSAIYASLAGVVDFRRCTDDSFLDFVGTLQSWFR